MLRLYWLTRRQRFYSFCLVPSLPAFPPENRRSLPPEKSIAGFGMEISPLHRFREGKCRDLVRRRRSPFPSLCGDTSVFFLLPPNIGNRDEEVDPGPIDLKPAGGESFSGRGGGREEVSPRLLLPPPITSNQVVFVFFTHSLKNKPSCFFCWTWNGS